jgi:hypothetical protein
MNRDAIERLALERAVTISAELEVQLDRNAKMRPMVAVLSLAKEQAAIAMRGLVFEDPTHADKIREFQNEVRRYDDLVVWLHKLIVDGKEADRRIDELDRQEFDDLLNSPEVADERRALGATVQDI